MDRTGDIDRHVVLEGVQATPVPILQAGVNKDQGKYQVSLLLDSSERPDLRALFREHLSQPEGECSSAWALSPGGSNGVLLLLSFTKPTQTKLMISFDAVKHGPLIDRLNEWGALVFAQGKRGEDLETAFSDGRGVLNVPIAKLEGWTEIWRQAIADHTGSSVDSATAIIEQIRTELMLRVQNPDIPPFDELAGVYFDREGKQLIFASNSMLINQITRDGPAVAASFDVNLIGELQALSPEFSKVTSYVAFGSLKATRSGDPVRDVAGQLIGNALHNVAAATDLVRLGYKLQPGILLRPAVEWAAMAGHLFLHPESLGRFKGGKLKSTDIIAGVSKEINPAISRSWSYLSQDFVHVSKLHQRVQLPTAYKSADDPAAKTNLLGIHMSLMVTSIIAELVFYDIAEPHEYWRQIKPGAFEFLRDSPVWQRMEDIASRLKVGE